MIRPLSKNYKNSTGHRPQRLPSQDGAAGRSKIHRYPAMQAETPPILFIPDWPPSRQGKSLSEIMQLCIPYLARLCENAGPVYENKAGMLRPLVGDEWFLFKKQCLSGIALRSPDLWSGGFAQETCIFTNFCSFLSIFETIAKTTYVP